MGSASLFSLDGVGLRIGDTTILHDVDVELPSSGISVLVGPSGSGKSTLLRLLNRLEVPTTGTVRFHGDDVLGLDPQRLRCRVGMVFQKPTVFDGTGFDNLAVADPSIDRSRASDLLDRVGLQPALLDREASDLSGGEAQRLCLARTLATGPEVILLDEPTSALDRESVHVIEHLARALVDDGIVQIWVSHDREQVQRLADWVIRMEDGTVAESGTSDAMGHVHVDDELWVTNRPDRSPEEGSADG